VPLKRKLRIGIFKLSSCDGCQTALMDQPSLWDLCEVAYWLLGADRKDPPEVEVAFVEGSVSTPEEREFLKRVRERSRILVSLGACATSGGIQALRNFMAEEDYLRIYPQPEHLRILSGSLPVGEVVQVDQEIYGCPVNPKLFENFLISYLYNKKPRIPDYPLCMECKLRGNICVMDAYGIPCLGPVVRAGCGALCPAVGRGCYGCFGPCRNPNLKSLTDWFEHLGVSRKEIREMFRNENAYAPEFRKVLEEYLEGDQNKPADAG